MGPVDASPSEALSYLETHAPGLLESVTSGSCVPWFGSGISRSRFPNVPSLLMRSLVETFERGTPGDRTCPFYSTFLQIIALAPGHSLPLTDHPNLWPDAERRRVLNILTGHYADILSINIATSSGSISLRWDVLNLIAIYSDGTVLPDAEHIFIAQLVEEGVFPDMVTTNWDPLIERADAQMNTTRSALIHAIACNDELNTVAHAECSRLYKIHGCAHKSSVDLHRYKPYLIATRLDLGRFTTEEFWRPFKDALSTLLRQRSVVFVGLSGQDFNLQVQLINASLARSPFDRSQPRIIFCEPELTANHRMILTSLYGEADYASHQGAIDHSARLPLFGKPLLGALFLSVLFQKLSIVIDRGGADFRPGTRHFLVRTFGEFKSDILAYLDANHDKSRLDDSWQVIARRLSGFLTWFVSIYRRQTCPLNAFEYRAFLPGTITTNNADEGLSLRNYHWMAWAILLIHAGSRLGKWQVAIDTDFSAANHPLTLTVNGVPFKLFIVGDENAGLSRLLDNGQIDLAATSRAAVIYPAGREPARNRRSPSRRLPGAASREPFVELWLRDLYNESTVDEEAINLIQAGLV